MQKTAYDMRISDWSSDVCSSDLICVGEDDPGLVRIGAALRVPCVDQLGPRSLARLGRVDHAVLLIGMDRFAGAARRQRTRGVATPVDTKSVVEGTNGSVRCEVGWRRFIQKKRLNRIYVEK